MSEPFLAEIRIFAGNFAPAGWAQCNGQLLPISQNTALFSLLGTTYGGNGLSTFALPDLRGRAPMQPGNGPGLSFRALGETGGSAAVSLLDSEMPNHTHALRAVPDPGDLNAPGPDRAIARTSGGFGFRQDGANPVVMANQSLSPQGGGQPHNNRQPYLAVTIIIALQGIFPQRP